jgi:hypothetical protein
MVLVDMIHLLMDLMVDQQKLYSPCQVYLDVNSQILLPLKFVV